MHLGQHELVLWTTTIISMSPSQRKQKIGKYFNTEELPYVLSCISLNIHTLKQTLIVKLKDTHCLSICNL